MTGLWPEKSWTHEELITDFPSSKTLGDVILETESMAKRENLVVCEIRANGLRLTEEQEILYKNTPLLEMKTFTVKLQKIETLLDESLAGCCEYLAKLTESMEAASGLFRSEDLVTAHKYYKTCVEGTQLFIEMIANYKIVYQKARGALGFDWKQFEEKLLLTLGQILDAYKKKNYILVADLLEYDLIGVLTTWREELIKLEQNGRRDNSTISEIQT